MARFYVSLDDEVSQWLAARIDDEKPTIRDVAQAVLKDAVFGMQDKVGDRKCECDKLEKLSREPDTPVVFEDDVNEYQLVRQTPHGFAKHRIRYCLWCGGWTPPSRRDRLFADVDPDEVRRLTELCSGISTFDDALARFGPPDDDWADGLVRTVKTEQGADEHHPHRVVLYRGLSDVADVRITQRVGDTVSVSFTGKYIGPPRP